MPQRPLTTTENGVLTMLPYECMCAPARKLRDTYAITRGAPLFKREFGYYSLEAWRAQGLPESADLAQVFDYDPPGNHSLNQLGWCEAAFVPEFEVKVIESRGGYEVEQDRAGRHVLYFKGRRNGFMPDYLEHPVKDQRTWEENVQWRMDPTSPERYADLRERMSEARACAAQGMMIVQNVIGGYMYLRSLMGPEPVLCVFYEAPELIHDCMRAWFALADAVIARHQEFVTIDELFLAEDICYNHGALIGPETMREFLLPYYQQLIANVRARQPDQGRKLYIQIDTDGHAPAVIDVYREMGMNVMSPFEVAAGCDVVELGQRYPDLVMFGGIDKRVLAHSKAAIDAHLERILPPMRARGGYIPTCDHGVPEEVTLDNYLHYRKRCVELGG
ncbi:MAG TPA: uroporphyrinogen decarboxylase family protein [Candidatus Hydrogenedentes bacterium]|mgnify:CR=1 FL=1|nr:uroporphyrinogen decarboxylase family protein [Candidatus Hydrogenedentota bacterium]HQE82864.1 uroporphyrinogen decarboxylase family protein [Candidatus Hydrogenedentota bacterium]HQH52543.1 uroporphyrinogen decarboxylase family protein [Candidatus Hydrogenedentota bacterium]HQM48106.1 uroporphyrinogen decarboxylase family protein [Candidatus Hydrogenedentota bacterium]